MINKEKINSANKDKNVTIKIKHRWTGKTLFKYKKENNTVKDTVVMAVRTGISLSCANLSGVDLSGVDLGGANFYNADLRNADLSGAHLRYTDLRGANLFGANLFGADIFGAHLCSTYFCSAKNVPYVPLNCPSDGAFIGWKKVKNKLIKLEIPEDAKRLSATTMTCRCDKARVLAITDLNGENSVQEILCETCVPLLYKIGEMVYPDTFDENRWNTCSHGIHFFINKQDAINY